MNNLIIGSLVYNEEHKFLDNFLNKISQLSNKIVIIDDGSTDNSISICSKYTSNISITNRLMTKNESILRQKLWNECIKISNNNDYIFIIDCDELLTTKSIENFEKEINKAEKLGADSIAHKKYDMWNNYQYREEYPLWKAHYNYLVWCTKYHKNYNYYWRNMNLHCGSLPINSY